MDPIILDDIDDIDAEDDVDEIKEDEYGNQIPKDLSILHADGDIYNLNDPDQVTDLIERLKALRTELQDGNLKKYEGRSTDWGGGGRSRLLYDQVRADLAHEYHEGRHNMSSAEQHQEAMKIVRIVAIRNRARF